MKKPTLQPLGDRILIAARPKPETTEKKIGDIIIPANVSAGQTFGVREYYQTRVLAVGPECKAVKKGETIIVREGEPWLVKVGESEHWMTQEKQVVAVVR
jgi:co-chaperonin GroES (HSP10)